MATQQFIKVVSFKLNFLHHSAEAENYLTIWFKLKSQVMQKQRNKESTFSYKDW